MTLRRALVPLLIAVTLGLAGCGKDDKADPATTSTPAATTQAPSSPAATPTQASESPSATPEGPSVGTPGPASAEALAACRAAIKKQFEMAQNKQNPGGMPEECKALNEAELTKLISEMMNGKS